MLKKVVGRPALQVTNVSESGATFMKYFQLILPNSVTHTFSVWYKFFFECVSTVYVFSNCSIINLFIDKAYLFSF